MSITREQVADLRPGDVVELRQGDVVTRGPLSELDGELYLGSAHRIRRRDGRCYLRADLCPSLTVISRAPRPLYVNHDHREKPASGDVARDEDVPGTTDSFVYLTHVPHCSPGWFTQYGSPVRGENMPTRLRLLVDGKTGQVVR